MDKAQKQLVDTYFRKREIAQKQGGWGYEFEPQELAYMLKNEMYDKVNPDKLSGPDIGNILVRDPSLIKILEYDLKKLSNSWVVEILKQRPELVQYFEKNLATFNAHPIKELLLAQPSLIRHMKAEKLMSLSTGGIRDILSAQPSAADDLMMFIRKFDSEDLAIVLIKQPSLVEKFKPYLHKIDKQTAKMIGDNIPELKSYMNNIKRENTFIE